VKRFRSLNRVTTVFACLSCLIAFALPSGACAKGPCEDWVARIVSVEGVVEVRRAGAAGWAKIERNDTICADDSVRVDANSRAAVEMSNETILRLDQHTTVTFSSVEKEETFLLKLLTGSVHFFSRTPRGIKVITPFVNAAVGGTEFFIKVEPDRTTVSVFEGKVTAANDAGSIAVAAGETALTLAGKPPVRHVAVHPLDAVQWALYYPPILDYRPADFAGGSTTGWEALVRRSLETYWGRDAAAALGSLEGAPGDITDPRFFTYRAALFVSVGRVEEAEADIRRALELDPADSHAFALRSVIAVVRNRKKDALDLARKAVELDPGSAAALVALSYAQQAHFDLDLALESLLRAVGLAPDNGLAWARLAELWLSTGRLDKALDAARHAVELNPGLARTQTVLGFAYLTQIKIQESKEAFEKAIERDQADPLPRLGLGLAKIRDGDLKGGRREIEIAVVLDPGNSLIRSYLGKAYFEEKRDKRASEQFELAKELDPMDPTPWFYDAIRKQTVNRPVEALKDLQKSIELNDNRAVYRSRLQLDEDLAARSAGLARIYDGLGFRQRALTEAWNSLNVDPSNYSAHRFLSDSYAVLPRHQIGRVSELLQSQLLQPININPVQPELAEAGLFILNGAGPTAVSLNEFNPLFERNRLALVASGVAGGEGTLGDELIHSGLWRNLSYSLGQFHYETDGFRPNNDQQQDIYNFFTQVSLTPRTSVQAEFRDRDFDQGDLVVLFDPSLKNSDFREESSTRSIRFGFHHSFSPQSDVIGTMTHLTRDSEEPPREKAETSGIGGEAQHLFHSERFSVITGAGHFEEDCEEVDLDVKPPTSETHSPHTNLYAYSLINYPESVIWTIGASGDFFESDNLDLNKQQFNPKLGLTWRPFPSTTLRAAAFRTLKRTLLTDQTLEPTQVAGFSQFFDDYEGTDAWRYGVGIDQVISGGLYAGAELSQRDLTVTGQIVDFKAGRLTIAEADWRERLVRTYLYWAPHPWLAIAPEYQYENFERPEDLMGPESISTLDTHRFSLGVGFFHPSGVLAWLRPSYVLQDGVFGLEPFAAEPGDDHFFVLDASIGFRLPRRLGVFSVEARNLFGSEFLFQDTDPSNPSIHHERLVLVRFTLSF
jgi:tetratricopeptide (TPR) repeat protein